MAKRKWQGGIEPGVLRGARVSNMKTERETDTELLAEVARMTADEFRARYIKGPNADTLMAEYLAAKSRQGTK